MAKQLCDLKKSLATNLDAYKKLVRDATHLCEKCGRVANEKKLLCSPVKLRK